MFKKIVSNLPFSPGLFPTLTFYSRRLRAEEATRQLGLIFIGLTVVVQVLFLTVPPVSSVSASTNDIVYGGIAGGDPKARMLAVYDSDRDSLGRTGIRSLFNHFQITREDIVNSTPGKINSNDRRLYSMGRNPHSNLDRKVTVGGQNYYLRPLHVWGNNVSYDALIGIRHGAAGNSDNKYFAIMYSCGNLVFKLTDAPEMHYVKTARTDNRLPAAGTKVRRGDNIGYRIFYSNLGAGRAEYIAINDQIPNHTEYVSNSKGAASVAGQKNGLVYPGGPTANHVHWGFNSIPPHTEHFHIDLTVKVKNDAPNGAKICNTGYIFERDRHVGKTNTICHIVEVPEKPTPPPPEPTQDSTPDVGIHKRVSNLTQSINDANGTVAQPGDILQYQLITTNGGDGKAKDYEFVDENLNDILEYADLIDPGDAKLKDGILSWPKTQSIDPSETVIKTFKVQVKNPLPTTPQSQSDPTSYDLRMDNVYGNTVSVHLPGNAPKIIEQSTKALPNTGPGTTMLISLALVGGTTFFRSRNRLLIKELEAVKEIQRG